MDFSKSICSGVCSQTAVPLLLDKHNNAPYDQNGQVASSKHSINPNVTRTYIWTVYVSYGVLNKVIRPGSEPLLLLEDHYLEAHDNNQYEDEYQKC